VNNERKAAANSTLASVFFEEINRTPSCKPFKDMAFPPNTAQGPTQSPETPHKPTHGHDPRTKAKPHALSTKPAHMHGA